MRALVISGGGSKGAYAGGVAHYLMNKQGEKYDLFLGTSTGSLLLPHLALGDLNKIYKIYTSVKQRTVFSVDPFVIKKKDNREYVTINYLTCLWQFMKNKRTFGESKNLRKTISKSISYSEFLEIKNTVADLVVTVSNLSLNKVEYKSIKDFDYDEFLDWIWISCNFVPFMSLAEKNGYEYADGGFGCLIPIREAIRRGAKHVDAIVLDDEKMDRRQVLGKNPFSLLLSLLSFSKDQTEKNDIALGKLAAVSRGDVTLNLYYTPSKLTENSLIFDKKLMKSWWKQGYKYAQNKADQFKKP
ncbi:patatin [Nonlabens spongiae]|uniref:Patatin n=1 Tax=Nonlabens spongiae TaxID=331648 RepID=A0A1W6MHI9_9FLAO|nr:patatin-like phospholipase family protein [Nonlabens spongiae]ARN76939.1 patatin [Nonlabens spongiae]